MQSDPTNKKLLASSSAGFSVSVTEGAATASTMEGSATSGSKLRNSIRILKYLLLSDPCTHHSLATSSAGFTASTMGGASNTGFK